MQRPPWRSGRGCDDLSRRSFSRAVRRFVDRMNVSFASRGLLAARLSAVALGFTLSAFVACSPDDDTDDPDGDPADCKLIANRCHPYDDGSNLAHDCHEVGHEGESPKKCTEMKAQCLAFCPPSDPDSGTGGSAGSSGGSAGSASGATSSGGTSSGGTSSGGQAEWPAKPGRLGGLEWLRGQGGTSTGGMNAAGKRAGSQPVAAAAARAPAAPSAKRLAKARSRLPRRRRRPHRGVSRARSRRQRIRVPGTTRGLSRRLHRRRYLTRDDAVPRRLAGFGVLLAMVVAPSARASESYPTALEAALDMSCPPACTTCHTSSSGGELMANTPLGISARRAGLEYCNTRQLRDVIATLEANATDSDSDGVPDVAELRAGTDPNAAEGNLECYVPEPDEGCALAPRTASNRTHGGGVVRFRARPRRSRCAPAPSSPASIPVNRRASHHGARPTRRVVDPGHRRGLVREARLVREVDLAIPRRRRRSARPRRPRRSSSARRRSGRAS